MGDSLQGAREQLLADNRRRLGAGPDAAAVELEDWFVPQLYQSGDDLTLLPQKPRRLAF